MDFRLHGIAPVLFRPAGHGPVSYNVAWILLSGGLLLLGLLYDLWTLNAQVSELNRIRG